MQLSVPQPVTASLTAGQMTARPAHSQTATGFTSLLTASSDAQRASGKTRDEQVREAVEQLVASAFILPLMEEFREQPLDSDLFGGGFAEDTFKQQMDTVIADRMVAGGNFPIVEVIHQRLSQTYQQRDDARVAMQTLDIAA